MFVKKFAVPAAISIATVALQAGTMSGAAAAEGGEAYKIESKIGPGQITHTSSVDEATGATQVSTVTTGAKAKRGGLLGLGGGGSSNTTGGVTAGVQQTHTVQPGTYEVTVVWEAAQGSRSTTGDATAQVTLGAGASSSVVGAEGEGQVGANAPAPSSPTTITKTLPDVVVDQTGELNLSASISTTTFARTAGTSAEASGSVGSLSLDFRPVGEPAAEEPPAEEPAEKPARPCLLGICL